MFAVEAVGVRMDAAISRKIDMKTKPLGALGRIEALAAQICRAQQTLAPAMNDCSLTIFAGDHGVAAEGVSAFPQQVTRQMVMNFLAGGAAANVFAKANNIRVRVVDAGVAGEPLAHPALISRNIAAGTKNFLHEAAMSEAQLQQALRFGRELGASAGGEAAIFGEMGIANTSSASLIAHKLGHIALEDCVGRGTGVDDAGLKRKLDILARACARTGELDALGALREYGGFEVAQIAGAMIGAAQQGKIVLVDGFIASAAALAAVGLSPALRDYLVFAHRSAEGGHRFILALMEARPLLQLDMRLGEGTGGALAWPLLRAAAAMVNNMASFESAGISGGA